MGFLSRFFGAKQPAAAAERIEPRADIVELTLDEYARLLSPGGRITTTSGIDVTAEGAIYHTTTAICLRVLGESVASLPCIMYRKRKDGGRDRASDHPTFNAVHSAVNGWLTPFEYFEGQMVNLCTRGNGYAYLDRDSRGRVIGMTPLNPEGVSIEQARDWSPIYTATLPDNTRQRLGTPEIHHIRGPLPKGYLGRSMVSIARDTIGLGIAAERFGASLFANGARPSGTLTHPKTLSEPAIKRLKVQIEDQMKGADNWNRPLVLEEGLQWTQTTMTPEDAQFLETRKFQRAEIAGIFRVPAHLINDLEKATFSNIEHQSLDFVIHSLRPWLKRWEQAMRRDLLIASEREEYFFEFLIDDLVRGDFKTRMEALKLQIEAGIRNPDEARALENLPPRADGKGGEYWRPGNMYPPKAGTEPANSNPPV